MAHAQCAVQATIRRVPEPVGFYHHAIGARGGMARRPVGISCSINEFPGCRVSPTESRDVEALIREYGGGSRRRGVDEVDEISNHSILRSVADSDHARLRRTVAGGLVRAAGVVAVVVARCAELEVGGVPEETVALGHATRRRFDPRARAADIRAADAGRHGVVRA